MIDVSLPQNDGRQKGFGYAEFEDRESLIEALSMTDEVSKCIYFLCGKCDPGDSL